MDGHGADRTNAVYLTHGEPDAADQLRLRIRRSLGWTARVPDFGERVSATAATGP